MYTNQITEFKSKKSIPLFAALVAFSLLHMPAAYGQVATTLRDPLVHGASSGLPGVPAPMGFATAPGSGPIPLPTTPGMIGPPTLIPSIPAMPSNQIGSGFSGIGLPISPATALPPGTWGPLLSPFIPNSPSTPGVNPAPYGLKGLNNPAIPSQVMPGGGGVGGGLPGTGGYYTTVPQVRRLGTQKSAQYELRGRRSMLGGGGYGGVSGNGLRGVQDEITQTGPLSGFGLINGIPTGVGYNKGIAGTNIDNYNKSIDLGGGMRTRVGGVVLPLGKTIQDNNGYNVLYGNATPSLGASLSTEYGQGAPLAYTTAGRGYNRTTDFGFPLTPQMGLNAHPNEPLHTLPQNAIETNF